MAADVLTNEITVESAGDEYTFRIPSPLEFGAISLRARALRVRVDPGAASEVGIDALTRDMFRGAALFELLLLRASVTWPWTQVRGNLVVDSTKFPPDRVYTLADVYAGFDDKLSTFLSRGAGYKQHAGDEVVEGQPNPAEVAV